MKKNRLGPMELLVLLATQSPEQSVTTSCMQIKQRVEEATKTRVALGAIFTTLTRLAAQGYIRKNRFKIYTITAKGRREVAKTLANIDALRGPEKGGTAT